MSQNTYDANDILMGGSHAPAWKFDQPGTTRTGVIASPPTARQERDYDANNPGGGALKTFPSGDPIMGIVIDVATDERLGGDDDGKRTFYVEGRYLKEAVRNGVRASGAQRLEVGGRLTVTFTHREDPQDKRSRKYWQVQYLPAAQTALDQTVATEQGPVNATTGEIQQPAAAAVPPVTQPPAAPAQTAPPVQVSGPVYPPGVSPEAVAAVKAAGQDPTVIFPGYRD